MCTPNHCTRSDRGSKLCVGCSSSSFVQSDECSADFPHKTSVHLYCLGTFVARTIDEFSRLSVFNAWLGSQSCVVQGAVDNYRSHKAGNFKDSFGSSWHHCLLAQAHGIQMCRDAFFHCQTLEVLCLNQCFGTELSIIPPYVCGHIRTFQSIKVLSAIRYWCLIVIRMMARV